MRSIKFAQIDARKNTRLGLYIRVKNVFPLCGSKTDKQDTRRKKLQQQGSQQHRIRQTGFPWLLSCSDHSADQKKPRQNARQQEADRIFRRQIGSRQDSQKCCCRKQNTSIKELSVFFCLIKCCISIPADHKQLADDRVKDHKIHTLYCMELDHHPDCLQQEQDTHKNRCMRVLFIQNRPAHLTKHNKTGCHIQYPGKMHQMILCHCHKRLFMGCIT